MLRSPLTGAARRTIAEADIVNAMLDRGWPIEMHDGRSGQAKVEARQALERFVGLGLPFAADAAGGRRFDLAEVTNFMTWAGYALGDRTYARRLVTTGRRLALDARGLASGDVSGPPPAPAELAPRRFSVTLRRHYALAGVAPGRRMRLRLPVPVEDATLGDLAVTVLPPDGLACEASAAEGRIDLIVAAPAAGGVSAGIRAEFTATNFPTAASRSLDDAERALYLRPDEGLVRITGRIADLARTLAAGAPDAAAAVERFWSFSLENLGFGYVHYDLLDPAAPLDGVLDAGWFDCRIGSAFIVALCRARGIPARLVSGYPLYRHSPGYHTWAEVWIDEAGWKPLDLFAWGMTEDRETPGGWRDYFNGWLDYRMVLERPPLLFAGTGSVRLPPAWDLLNYPEGKGSVAEFREAGTDTVIYREYAEIEPLGS